jgi:hypothetical protein
MWHKTQRTENLFGGRQYLLDSASPAHAPTSVPGGAIGYPAHPRLIRLRVCQSVFHIIFNHSAENRLG